MAMWHAEWRGAKAAVMRRQPLFGWRVKIARGCDERNEWTNPHTLNSGCYSTVHTLAFKVCRRITDRKGIVEESQATACTRLIMIMS
jgi:hypothetical protein